MSQTDSDRSPVEMLAEEFSERLRAGEHPSITEYVERHPEWADQIDELFPSIVLMEQLSDQKHAVRKDQVTISRLLGPKAEQLGDYRIVREIGRGGMGIVYEAEQTSLGRRVALKILSPQTVSSPRQLQRFRREAKAAARLHHTNIVPVFGVGKQDDLHYYVMQYIQGRGLDEVLSEPIPPLAATGPDLPYWRNIAEIGVQVAGALDYAHSQRILHRDIKPSNLLMDTRGTVWIADFGLVKLAEEEDLTKTGDFVGTLRYMAPEQFEGQADTRSDIYSLGLTFYELLTLRPAFDDTDGNRLGQRLKQQSPPRPRTINARIPRDLETITLKATAFDPDHRYPTAGALAEDLQRFLDDRPILARRITPIERLWRWGRRNRLVASLSGLALALLVLVAVVASVAYARTRDANVEVGRAWTGEKEQRKNAEMTSELALEALDRIFERFAPNRIVAPSALTIENAEGQQIEVPVPAVLSDEAAALLEDLLVFYDRLAERGDDDSRFQRKIAEANRRVGDIRQRLGQFGEARTAYERAIQKFQQLNDADLDRAKISTEIARVYNELGNVYRARQQLDAARESHAHARDLLESIASASLQAPPEVRYELARTYYLDRKYRTQPAAGPPSNRPPKEGAGRRPRADRPPESGRHKQNGPVETGRRKPDEVWESSPRKQKDSSDAGRREQDESNLQKAVVLLEQLVAQYPFIPDYRHLLARCYRDLESDGAAQKDGLTIGTSRTTKLLEDLVAEFPDAPDYRSDLSKTYAMLDTHGQALTDEQLPAAEKRVRKALQISEALVAEHPKVSDYVTVQVQICRKLGGILQRDHRLDEAEQILRKAVALQASLVTRFPEATYYQVGLAMAQQPLARLLHDQGKHDEALSILDDSIASLNELLETDSELWYARGPLMRGYESMADVLHRKGEDILAAEAWGQAEKHEAVMQGDPRYPPSRRRDDPRRGRPPKRRTSRE